MTNKYYDRYMFDKKSFITRVVIFIVILSIFYIAQQLFTPVVTNDVALKQLEDSDTSFATWGALQRFWDIGWYLACVLGIVMFAKEIKILVKKLF